MKKSQENRHRKILARIIELELDMFQKVRTSQPSLCQEHPNTFKAMREMNFIVLSLETLKSYLNDLKKAKNRNLLTEKYARMNNLIPPLKNNPIIAKIVNIEKEWISELTKKYPFTFKRKASNFKNYLTSELETFSEKTLELFYNDLIKARTKGKNLTEERYLYLFKKMGYNSILEIEEKYHKK
jgi:hypothetical protein